MSKMRSAQSTTETTKPAVYQGAVSVVHDCGKAIQPEQYPMKYAVLTIDLLVLPRTLDAFRLMVSEKILEIQLPSQAPMIIGRPFRGSTNSMMHPVNGIATRPMMMAERLWGQMKHAPMPSQIATI